MSFLESKSSPNNQSSSTLLNTTVNDSDYDSVYFVLHDDEEEKTSQLDNSVIVQQWLFGAYAQLLLFMSTILMYSSSATKFIKYSEMRKLMRRTTRKVKK